MKFQYPLVLASNSPRRKKLLEEAGFEFTVRSKNLEENYPPELRREQIPLYLANMKAETFRQEITNEIVIAADTIVYHYQRVVGKPNDRNDAIEILTQLSGTRHEVITGVAIVSANYPSINFYEVTQVFFRPLSKEQITYYVDQFKPYDKAGAYGIQEWIGLIGVERIEGCFYNVMGLPISKLYSELMELQHKIS